MPSGENGVIRGVVLPGHVLRSGICDPLPPIRKPLQFRHLRAICGNMGSSGFGRRSFFWAPDKPLISGFFGFGETGAGMSRESAHEMAQLLFARKGAQNNAYDDRVWAYLLTVYRGCKKNAAARDRAFTITELELRTLYDASGGKCALSGKPFDLDRMGSTRAPFSPSIDRIDCAQGYTRANVRLVAQIVNLAMNVWGEPAIAKLLEPTT